jgi:hypothetical protein
MTGRRWLAVAVVAFLVLGGLAAWMVWDRDERSGPVTLVGDDPRISIYDSNIATLIRFQGSMPVSYDPANRCLSVTDRQGEVSLVLWPEGSRPVTHEGRPGVRVPGLGVVTAGDVVADAGIDRGDIHGNDNFGIGPALLELDTCLPESGSYFVLFSITEVRRGDAAG